jgi:hypothetical protein
MFKAAVLYDLFTIQIKGMKAQTNFNYTYREIMGVLALPCLIKLRNSVKEER